MRISSIETSFIDYPGQTSMVIFMTGCTMGCPNCHNPALQDPNFGSEASVADLKDELAKRSLCRAVVFSGGDPLFQEQELILACKELSKLVKIGIYTGRSLKDVPVELFQYISFLKTEPYIEKLGSVQYLTTNQKCWDIVEGIAVENKEYFKIQ